MGEVSWSRSYSGFIIDSFSNMSRHINSFVIASGGRHDGHLNKTRRAPCASLSITCQSLSHPDSRSPLRTAEERPYAYCTDVSGSPRKTSRTISFSMKGRHIPLTQAAEPSSRPRAPLVLLRAWFSTRRFRFDPVQAFLRVGYAGYLAGGRRFLLSRVFTVKIFWSAVPRRRDSGRAT